MGRERFLYSVVGRFCLASFCLSLAAGVALAQHGAPQVNADALEKLRRHIGVPTGGVRQRTPETKAPQPAIEAKVHPVKKTVQPEPTKPAKPAAVTHAQPPVTRPQPAMTRAQPAVEKQPQAGKSWDIADPNAPWPEAEKKGLRPKAEKVAPSRLR